ncbi:MAG: hypothetical protein AABY22_00850, partial [Nanoarchaeota archaeon]
RDIDERYRGKSPVDLENEDSSLYNEARSRGLINKLVKKGVLIRLRRKDGIFTSMSDEDLIKYITRNHSGISPRQLEEKDGSIYNTLLQRKIIDQLIQDGILIRAQRKHGVWKSLDFVIEEAKKIMKIEGWSEFPGEKSLSKNYSSIAHAISKYHGGFPAFRQLLNERLGIQSGESQLEDIIDEYIGGEDE